MQQQIKTNPIITKLIFFLIALAVTILIGGYRLNWAWTGFTGEKETYRTLYDWLQLLFIPVVLAVAGFWFNHRERRAAEKRAENEQKAAELRSRNEQKAAELRAKTEREIEQQHAKTERDIAEDNQREAVLQEYINKMSELLLHENLRKSEQEDEVQNIARVRTLTVLPRLNGERKGIVLQFLYESGLISKDNTIIDLNGADFDGIVLISTNLRQSNLQNVSLVNADLADCDFTEADFSHSYLMNSKLIHTKLVNANLMFANLTVADLYTANCSNACLTNAFLNRANLKMTNLRGADLSRAHLNMAKMYMVDLSGANLSDADLFDAEIKYEQLSKAKSLKGATMPDEPLRP